MACKAKYFNDTPAKKKHHAESNIVAEELPTLSFYTTQNATMGDGDSVNRIQLLINFSSHKDVCLYKNLIYPKALRMRWNHLNISLQKYLVAVFQAINILVFQLQGEDYKTVAENYRLSERTKGLQEPLFWHITDDDQLELGAHREVPNKQDFMYSFVTVEEL